LRIPRTLVADLVPKLPFGWNPVEAIELLGSSKVNSLNVTETCLERIETEFRIAENLWAGCDWNTEFGAQMLDLKGMTAKRTRLLSNATSGAESKTWQEASAWLEKVEADSAMAKSLAKQAVTECRNQNWKQALFSIEAACAIESLHHTCLVWKPLQEAIARFRK
jgi:hypothetical protein